jgi:hypothetical protein
MSPDTGPCWAIARVIADAGYGTVEYCQTSAPGQNQWWGHFIVRTPEGAVIDVAGEYITSDAAPDYKDFKVEDGPDHYRYKPKHLTFWRNRLRKALTK